jgi:predicted alpha/beta-fold hydrolase
VGPLHSTHQKYVLPDQGTVCTLTFLPEPFEPSTPLIFFLPTFASNAGEFEPLIECYVKLFRWAVVVYHKRGVHCPLSTAPFCVVGNDADQKMVMDNVHQRYPTHPIFCIGESAGGTSLLRFLGKYRPSYVRGAVAISSAVHGDMYKNMPVFFARRILMAAQQKLKDYQSKHKLSEFEASIYRQLQQPVQSAEQFVKTESQLFCPSYDTFLRDFSVENYVPHITVPVLVINGKDDVVCREPLKFTSMLSQVPFSLFVVTELGGHCAFLSSSDMLQRINWAEFIAALFVHYLVNVNVPDQTPGNPVVAAAPATVSSGVAQSHSVWFTERRRLSTEKKSPESANTGTVT